MTQLNLSGRQSDNTKQKLAAEHDESIKNQTVGALGALAMFAAVIVIGSCSTSKPGVVQKPIQPTAPVSAPAAVATTAAPAPAPVVAKARVKKHRAATVSYVNREYGLSFDFPRNYQLKAETKTTESETAGLKTAGPKATGNETQVASTATEPVEMNFVHAGGVMLATVEMPGNSYPATDFKSGFVNLSVNPGMSADACAQFAFPETSMGTDASPIKVQPVKLGAIEFQEIENSGGAAMKQADAKYYHVFGNGACYEFALGIGTDGDGNVDEIKPVDRAAVFAKLEKILATVKFQPAVMRETGMPENKTTETQTPGAVAASTAAGSSSTPETTSSHTPEQNAEPNQEKSAPLPNF